MPSVLQKWVEDLPLMQQSVLVSSIRGCDGASKEHPSKAIIRWFRRCVLISAFDGQALESPTSPGGGSFTGPLKALVIDDRADTGDAQLDVYIPPRVESDQEVLGRHQKLYFDALDELPLHFHSHLMHAAQITGIHHPVKWIAKFWYGFYETCVRKLHLNTELPSEMNKRLGDSEKNWKARE